VTEVPAGLPDTLSLGTTVACFEALRDQIALDLEVCSSMRDRAALYLRLIDVLKVLAELRPAVVEGDAVDEIAARRSARRSGSPARQARTQRAADSVGGRR
jgi:hypothetical protein